MFLFTVNSSMLNQIIACWKLLEALVTRKSFLTNKDSSDDTYKNNLCWNLFLSSVGSSMLHQIIDCWKWLWALVTRKAFLTGDGSSGETSYKNLLFFLIFEHLFFQFFLEFFNNGALFGFELLVLSSCWEGTLLVLKNVF